MFVTNYKKCFENGELMELVFDENLKKNYIKAVSNIYYLNIRKIQLILQNEFINNRHVFHDDRSVFIKIQDIYNKSLKETRVEVCNFFNIKATPELSLKIMMRIYYYYLPVNDEARNLMDLINFQVNYILDRLSIGYKFSLIFSENDPRLYKEPTDVDILNNL